MTKTTKVIKQEVNKHEHSSICHNWRNDKSRCRILDLLFPVFHVLGGSVFLQYVQIIQGFVR